MAWALGSFKDPRAVAPLTAHLKDPDWDVAIFAAGDLVDIRVQQLADQLNDKKEKIGPRTWAANRLGEIGPPAVEALIEALKNTKFPDSKRRRHRTGNNQGTRVRLNRCLPP